MVFTIEKKEKKIESISCYSTYTRGSYVNVGLLFYLFFFLFTSLFLLSWLVVTVETELLDEQNDVNRVLYIGLEFYKGSL